MKLSKKTTRLYEYLLITIGTALVAISISVFFARYSMVTGGFTGLAIVIEEISSHFGFSIPIWLTTIVLNIPLLVVALRVRGFGFVVKTLYATVLLSAALFLAEFIPHLEMDLTLAAVFGGVIQGIGLGLVFRCMASTGGTDLIASIVTKFRPHMPIQRVLFAIDFCIIAIGFFIFGALKAMYAIIAVFIIQKVVERILEGLNFAKAAFIISQQSEVVAQNIMAQLGRGVTGLSGHGMYTGAEKTVILCAVSTKQIITLKHIVYETDPNAFVMVADVREVLGEGFTETA